MSFWNDKGINHSCNKTCPMISWRSVAGVLVFNYFKHAVFAMCVTLFLCGVSCTFDKHTCSWINRTRIIGNVVRIDTTARQNTLMTFTRIFTIYTSAFFGFTSAYWHSNQFFLYYAVNLYKGSVLGSYILIYIFPTRNTRTCFNTFGVHTSAI